MLRLIFGILLVLHSTLVSCVKFYPAGFGEGGIGFGEKYTNLEYGPGIFNVLYTLLKMKFRTLFLTCFLSYNAPVRLSSFYVVFYVNSSSNISHNIAFQISNPNYTIFKIIVHKWFKLSLNVMLWIWLAAKKKHFHITFVSNYV